MAALAAVSLRVMTYNVHSCAKGLDRVAEVIALQRPDVVALQEVRAGRAGEGDEEAPGATPPAVGEPPLPPLSALPGRPSQPRELARRLGMRYVFYPLVRLPEEDYGIAVLSRHPMRVVRAQNLPTLPGRKALERRGAIWVELDVGGRKVQLLNTHLGLRSAERAAQVEALAGPQWLGEAAPRGPLIVCGDLNSTPGGKPYRALAKLAADVGGGARTFPARLPLLRLDYVFAAGLRALGASSPRGRLERRASDHLPVVVDLALE